MPFAQTLIHWYERHGRDLPWRHTRNPWHILTSEVILQQTQVKQGWDYYLRFIQRFPTPQSMAAAGEDEVMTYWQGLGYYSRARHLHAAAKALAGMPTMPRTAAEWQKLPGVGPYTAAAVASIAFGEAVAVVDGNVCRVLSRHFALDTPIDTASGLRLIRDAAQSLLPHDAPDLFNQAIMDFGATVCRPRRPDCEPCPLHATCLAHRQGRTEAFPFKSRAVHIEERHLLYLFILTPDGLWLRRRPGRGIWPSLFEPACFDEDTAEKAERQALQFLHDINPEATPQTLATPFVHQLTHRKLHCAALWWQTAQPLTPPNGFEAVAFDALQGYAMPVPVTRLLSRLPIGWILPKCP